MADFKSMYYHLAGRMATAVEVLEYATDALVGTTQALATLTEKLKLAQQDTEAMFINDDEEQSKGNSE
ncbi:MAG: hypothetical protein M0R40_00180 [Firmicutes bacterium]|nr:hypothetical protein [Bacillota bacterium]